MGCNFLVIDAVKFVFFFNLFQSFMESDFARRVEETLENPPERITKDIYLDARDYLLTRVALANRQRAGAIANMTVHAFKQAKKSDVEGIDVWTIVTTEHKTAGTYGGATLGLECDLYDMMVKFTDNIR